MRLGPVILLSFITAFNANVASAQLKVAASIKPIHSLVSSVMGDIATPQLLVEAGSPHTYSLKPSQAQYLQTADAVFWLHMMSRHFSKNRSSRFRRIR
jgi:zinc transport system substrate-binding protein